MENKSPQSLPHEGMRYGPPEPPELHPDKKLAQLMMQEAGGDMQYYNLLMLRGHLVTDRARKELAPGVFEQNYPRLNRAIAKQGFQEAGDIISTVRPPQPTTRAERRRASK